MTKVVDGESIRTESGETMHEPSEDKLIAHVSEDGLAALSSSPVLGSGRNNAQMGNVLNFRVSPRHQKGRDISRFPIEIFRIRMNA